MRDVLRSPGQSLDPATRAFMESRFGHDFSNVRVRTDERAADSARTVNALAYTVGSAIVFGAGQYSPSTIQGRTMLAHELTHVLQQGGANRSGEMAYRLASAGGNEAAATLEGDSGVTPLLLAHIRDIEQVLAVGRRKIDAARSGGAESEGVPAESQRYIATVEAGLERMRSIAHGTDENLKRSVLAAFTPDRLRQAEAQVGPPEGTAGAVEVRERRPEGVASKALRVSHPQDAAEREADQVAGLVMSGASASVERMGGEDVLNRQVGEALTAAGTFLLAADTEAAPVEAATGPPGWAVGVGIAVVAVALIGTGYILMSSAGNVADTGIMDEVQQLIQAAKAAGTALAVCEALAQLMAAAERARDTQRMTRIKATQKAKGCRHSRHSG